MTDDARRPSYGSGWIGLRFSRLRGGGRPRVREPARRSGPGCSSPRCSSGSLFLSAAPILATFAVSLTHWDLLTPPESGRHRQLHEALQRPALPDRAPQHGVLHGRVGAARDAPVARAGPGPEPGDLRHLVDPDDVLPADRHLDDRHRPRLVVDLQPVERPAQRAAGRVRHPAAAVDRRSVLGDAVDHRDVGLAGPPGQHDHLSRRSPGDPARLLRRGERRRRRSLGPASAT